MNFLASYGLPSNPFAPAPPSRQMRAPAPPPEPQMPAPLARFEKAGVPDPTLADFVDLGRRVFDPEETTWGRGALPPVRDRLDHILSRMPPLPREAFSEDYAQPARRQAMTPMTGPDTGDENPNADYALPGGYFSRLKRPESGGDASIRNPVTGAGGMYQFLPSTWASIRKSAPQLALSPEGYYDPSPEGRAQQDRAVQYYTQESMRRLVSELGRQPTAGELYALHFLGHEGGMQLLRGLDRPVSETVSAAAIRSNPWLRGYADKPGRALMRRLTAMME